MWPKTAGTTIKKVLGRCTAYWNAYAEHLIDDTAAFIDVARTSEWIGGHVARDRFAKSLIWLNRPVEYFASVREPVAQLISHLNYSFERYRRTDYYNLHNRKEQIRDADVMATDFSDHAAVMSLLWRNAEDYLNIQSKFLLGEDFAEVSEGEANRRIASFTYVASETDLSTLYRVFGFRTASGRRRRYPREHGHVSFRH